MFYKIFFSVHDMETVDLYKILLLLLSEITIDLLFYPFFC
jgi:hypothetical protein